MSKKTTFMLGLLGFTIAACSAENEPGINTLEPAAESPEEIRNGIGVFPTTDAAVYIETSASIGSGTMLTPEWILTAAHVVKHMQQPSTIEVRWGNRDDPLAQTRKAIAVYHHPKYVFDKTSSPTDPNVVDAALIRVASGFTGAITRPMSTAATSSFVGLSLYCLGYGQLQDGVPTPGILTSALLPLVSASTNNARVNEGSTIFGTHMLLSGDSGGPCMDVASGAIVGVTSSGPTPATHAYLSTTSSFRSWVNGIIANDCAGSANPPNSASFCSTACPCTHGGTDCDAASGCGPGLTCDLDVGSAYGRDPTWDVCVKAECESRVQGAGSFCNSSCRCGYGGGDCTTSGCMGGLTCVDNLGAGFGMEPGHDVCVLDACTGRTLGSSTFCSSGCPCGYGGGDCDSNSQCMPGMACATDYGLAFDMTAGTDVCVSTACAGRTLYASTFCSDDCPCGEGGGDCDDDGDCMPGLECGTNNGADFGQDPTWDICVKP